MRIFIVFRKGKLVIYSGASQSFQFKRQSSNSFFDHIGLFNACPVPGIKGINCRLSRAKLAVVPPSNAIACKESSPYFMHYI